MAAKVDDILDIVKGIKKDIEFIKHKIEIEEVETGGLSSEEKKDLDEATKDVKKGEAVKLDDL